MNPTDGIQPTTATGGLDNALSQPDSPAGTTATPDILRGSQTTLDRDINAKGGCVVWRYPLAGTETTLRFAAGSILRVDFDPNGDLCAWVLVFSRDREITRKVLIRGTGEDLPDGDWVYLNTFTRGAFVFHAFVGWVR